MKDGSRKYFEDEIKIGISFWALYFYEKYKIVHTIINNTTKPTRI